MSSNKLSDLMSTPTRQQPSGTCQPDTLDCKHKAPDHSAHPIDNEPVCLKHQINQLPQMPITEAELTVRAAAKRRLATQRCKMQRAMDKEGLGTQRSYNRRVRARSAMDMFNRN